MFRNIFFLCVLGAGLAGCSHESSQSDQSQPPTVKVSHPLQQEVTDWSEYTGRTAAVNSVTIVPRVTGYIVTVPFKEGDEVKKGDMLFEIDPRPYQALVNQSKAQVDVVEAQYKLAQLNYERDRLAGSGVTPQQIDQDVAQVRQGTANLKAAQATLAANQLNLDFTKVTSPINGRVSNYFLTLGNPAIQDQTQLTTVVSQDPMYAYFDVDEPTVLHVRALIRQGVFQSYREKGAHVPVYLELSNEKDFPHEGYLDFANNQFTATTGTLRVRGIFANPRPEKGDRVLAPGMFVRVRVPVSARYDALLVSQDALTTDQNLNIVFVVDEKNQLQRRQVKLGTTQGGLQVIQKGLKPDDRIVVSGLQHLRPGTEVSPKLVDMPGRP